MMLAYHVITATKSEVLTHATMKYERFQFISDLFYLRLNYFESCQDMGTRPLPIVFVLNDYDYDTTDKKKVFKVADKLIEIGCDVNGYDEMGLTPLTNVSGSSW
jgi:nucleoside-specific outer membrane channel protein Tsx